MLSNKRAISSLFWIQVINIQITIFTSNKYARQFIDSKKIRPCQISCSCHIIVALNSLAAKIRKSCVPLTTKFPRWLNLGTLRGHATCENFAHGMSPSLDRPKTFLLIKSREFVWNNPMIKKEKSYQIVEGRVLLR